MNNKEIKGERWKLIIVGERIYREKFLSKLFPRRNRKKVLECFARNDDASVALFHKICIDKKGFFQGGSRDDQSLLERRVARIVSWRSNLT